MCDSVLNCCVCLSREFSKSISDCDDNNSTILGYLQAIVPQVEWESSFKICITCLGKLDAVNSFIELCIKSSLTRKEYKVKLETEVDLKDVDIFEEGFGNDAETNESSRSEDEEEESEIFAEECFIVCFNCKNNFKSSAELFSHIQNEHKSAQYECLYCVEAFTDRNELKKHDKECQKQCKMCISNFDDKKSLFNHYVQEHSSKISLSFSCTYCSDYFSSKQDLKEHLKQYFKTFTCFNCDKKFTSKVKLVSHMKKVHLIKNEDEFICEHCPSGFDTDKLLQKHLKKAHPAEASTVSLYRKKRHQCKKCFKAYTLEKSLKKHVVQCDGIRRHNQDNSKNICELCLRSYSTKKILKQHKKICNGVINEEVKPVKPKIKCKLCDVLFLKNEEHNAHLKSEHNINLNQEHLCKYCYIGFDSQAEYTRHVKSEHLTGKRGRKRKHSKTPDTKLSCELCPATFTHVKECIEHCASVHKMDDKSIKPYSCAECNRRYTCSNSYFDHFSYYHNRVRSHICSFCGKSFLTKSDLIHHEYIHKNTRNYACEQCPKAFNTSKNLSTHKLVCHTDPKLWKHVCNTCEKRFPMKSKQEIHVKRHEGEKNFSCHICGKLFVCAADSRKHMRTHSNVRDFKCTYCEREYKEKATYERHLKRAHNIGNAKIPIRIKNHFCHICPKSFYDKNKLAKHLCTHTGQRPFGCEFCPKKFTDKSYLTHHLKLEHNVYKNNDVIVMAI